MDFLHSEVSTKDGDAIVVLPTGSVGSVMAMDEANFQNYQSRRSFNFFGGHARQLPAVLWPPAGRWHVVVDLTGCARYVKAEVKVVPLTK